MLTITNVTPFESTVSKVKQIHPGPLFNAFVLLSTAVSRETMSTPLNCDKVKEIRDIIDYQLSHREIAAQPKQKMNRLKEKEAIMTRLACAKGKLDSKMDNYKKQQQPGFDQTMDVPTATTSNTWMQSTDESFLRWEQDCDVTMLPGATTTSSSSNNKTMMGKPNAHQDPEMAAIDRLMREYNLETRNDVCPADQTQLEDIEPPSGIWETTIIGVKSPIKALHAVRPSTIIEEESNATLGNVSLASSYKTAASNRTTSKGAPSERYDTATETICLSSDQSENTDTEVIEILDEEESNSEDLPQKTTSEMDFAEQGTLDGVSSLMPDDESCYESKPSSKDSGDFSLPESKDSLLEGDDDSAPDFNDTLERIEFMEKQGKRLLEQQKTKPSVPTTPQLVKTLLPASATAKRVFYPSPNSINSSSSSGTFKKPGFTRSPQVKFGPPKRNFDHIVSPIATYIKDVPTTTLYTKYKGQCLFSKNSPIKPNTAGETKENKPSQLKAPQWNIPRKVFTSTNNRHVSYWALSFSAF